MVFSRNTHTYLACIGYGVVGLTNTVFGAVLSPVAGAYGVSLAVAGLLVTLQYTGFVIAGPLSDELADRLGQRLVIPSGYALTALGLALFGAARSRPLTLAAVLLVGPASASAGPASTPMWPISIPTAEAGRLVWCSSALAAARS